MPAGTEDTAIAALDKNPQVKFAERNAVATATDTIPNDPSWVNQWSAVKTRAPAAWDVTTGSASVVVAVLDTGVDPTHPDLEGKLTAGRDFVNDDNDPSDDHGHGTAVAGIIGAVTNNSRGVAAYCWECRVMPVKVLSSGGAGWHSDIADGVVWAADNGARVINMSLAGASGTKTLESAVRYAATRGVVIVASAGNSGSTTPTYPAAYPDVIGVAGSNQTDTFYSWSTGGRGSTSPPPEATTRPSLAEATACSTAPRPPHQSLPHYRACFQLRTGCHVRECRVGAVRKRRDHRGRSRLRTSR